MNFCHTPLNELKAPPIQSCALIMNFFHTPLNELKPRLVHGNGCECTGQKDRQRKEVAESMVRLSQPAAAHYHHQCIHAEAGTVLLPPPWQPAITPNQPQHITIITINSSTLKQT
jgi:hypothetical protein